jgi:trigger factor
MKVTLDREGKNIVKLGLELESDKTIKAYEQTCRKLSQRIRIPGFRPGKAPRGILEKTVGVESIKREALEHLIPELVGEAIVSEQLELITEPEIDSFHFNLGDPLQLNVKFEVRPLVTLGNYKAIEVTVPEVKANPDGVETTLKSLAEAKAELKTIESRPVVMGDTVLIDFECYVDNKLVEGGKSQGLVLEVKPGSFIEGFCEQLVDKKPGEQFEVRVKFPNEYRNKELANKDALFKTEIKELRQKVTPEIDDALAIAYGQESLVKLKEAIGERLNEEVAQTNEINKQKAVVEAIVANAEVDIPESMIEREQSSLLLQLRKYMEQNNRSWEEFEKSSEFEAIKTSKAEEAKERVLRSLVLGAIIKAENITISAEELETYLDEVIHHYNLPHEKALHNEQLRRQVAEELLTSKVVSFVVDSAKITLTTPVAETPIKQA